MVVGEGSRYSGCIGTEFRIKWLGSMGWFTYTYTWDIFFEFITHLVTDPNLLQTIFGNTQIGD